MKNFWSWIDIFVLYYFTSVTWTFIFPFDVGLWMFLPVHIWSIWSDLHIDKYLQSIRKHFGIAVRRVEIANHLNLLMWYCQIMMNYGWVGLRGAMAFALALQSVHDLPEGHGQTIFTATTAIVVLTVGKLTFILN
jgi:hypothetical protein